MSAENPPYNPIYITAWTILSIVLGVGFLGAFLLCNHLLAAGHIVWDIIRYLASPFI
ncbi:MAG: hypothetical protein LV481_16845 [Methylacidiphilales bacterium]|nr:hypothetical protein [Candidatus Methylacidiphilales bacterium]